MPRVTEARNILEKHDQGGNILLRITKEVGAVKGVTTDADDDVQVVGLWQFKHRHEFICIGYAHAAEPEWNNCELTDMLAYHEWVMEKALETDKGKRRPPVAAVIEADFRMRTAGITPLTKTCYHNFL